MDDVSRRAASRLAVWLRGGLRRPGLTRRRALTAAPALLVLPLMASLSG